MNLFRTLNGVALFCLAGTGLSSCLSAPSYPIEPSIDFKEVRVVRTPPTNGQLEVDELTFVLNFRDGDGDLGLDNITVPPYSLPPTPGVPQRNHATNAYNFFIQPLVLNASTGKFVPYITPLIQVGLYDGTFPRLDLAGNKSAATDPKAAPLKGELRYKLPITIDGISYNPGQVLRFEITVMDRAFHVSNTVTTSDVKLGQ